MHEDDTTPTVEPSELQFERAEYSTPASAAAPCQACKEPIVGAYYLLGQAMICPKCHTGLSAQLHGGSRTGRFFGALAWGLLAAIAGGLIWFAVRKTTGYELGLVAIVVGVLVGMGVRRGARQRGGGVYQTMAVLLTYGCIATQYMPDVLEMVMKDIRTRDRVAATQPATRDTAASSATTASRDGASSATDPHTKPGLGKAIGMLIVAALLLFIIAMVAPILAGFHQPIGLLIIGFALYEAWKLNKRRQIPLSGPFSLSAPGEPLTDA